MLEAELIDYRYFIPWCDDVILRKNAPPDWILELATEEFQPDAISIVCTYAYSEPFIEFLGTTEFYVACLFLKYRIGQISWATFLGKAGSYTDAYQDSVDCSYFFCMLNDIEAMEFDRNLEGVQVEDVVSHFAHAIDEAKVVYNFFLHYFRQNKIAKAVGRLWRFVLFRAAC